MISHLFGLVVELRSEGANTQAGAPADEQS